MHTHSYNTFIQDMILWIYTWPDSYESVCANPFEDIDANKDWYRLKLVNLSAQTSASIRKITLQLQRKVTKKCFLELNTLLVRAMLLFA